MYIYRCLETRVAKTEKVWNGTFTVASPKNTWASLTREYISSDDFFRTQSPKPAQVTESHARPWSPKPGSSQDLTFLRALKVKAKWLDGQIPLHHHSF